MKRIFFFTFCSAFLMASTTVLSQNTVSITQENSASISTSSKTGVSITQESGIGGSRISIRLASGNLKRPYILTINAPKGTQLNGQVSRNGRVIRQLKGNNQASINLSPLLSKGNQTIKILGNYKPAHSSIRIQFSGPGTQVTQQTSGNGRLNQTLTINVQ